MFPKKIHIFVDSRSPTLRQPKMASETVLAYFLLKQIDSPPKKR